MENNTKINVGDVIRAVDPKDAEITYYMLGYSIKNKDGYFIDLTHGIIIDDCDGNFAKYHLDNMIDEGYDLELIRSSDFIKESENIYGDE